MYNLAVNNGTLTRNEKRKKMGLEPVPNGDVITVTAGAVVSTLDTIINPPAVPPPPPVLHAPMPPQGHLTAPEEAQKAILVQDARNALKALRKAM